MKNTTDIDEFPLQDIDQRSILIRNVPYGFHEQRVHTELLLPAGGTIEHIEKMSPNKYTVIYSSSLEARRALKILRDYTQNNGELDTIRLSMSMDSTALANYKDFVQQLRDSDKTLFVSNLSPITSRNTLRSFFERYGVVAKMPVIHQKDNGNLTGFVTFQEVEEADKGLCADGKVLDGSRIRVEPHKILKPFKIKKIVDLIPPEEA